MIGVIFLQKQLRSCQTKLIDTLLHISYHETVEFSFLFTGHCQKQIFLYQIAVLIFINQNFMKILPVLLSHSTGSDFAVFPAKQDIQGIMLHIRKVNNLLFLLFFPHAPVKLKHQINQYPHRLPAGSSLTQDNLQGHGKKLLLKLL